MREKVFLCIIVEDEPLAQQILENYIARLDVLKLVAKCQSIKEAFDVLHTNDIDIIFLDLNLEKENGLEIIKSAGGRKNQYMVVIMSAMSQKNFSTSELCEGSNFQLVDYLTKPFSYKRFESAIQKVIVQNDTKE